MDNINNHLRIYQLHIKAEPKITYCAIVFLFFLFIGEKNVFANPSSPHVIHGKVSFEAKSLGKNLEIKIV